MEASVLFISLISAIAAFVAGYALRIYGAQRKAEAILNEAKLQASERLLKLRDEFETSTANQRQEFLQLEKRLNQREERLDEKLKALDDKEQALEKKSLLIQTHEQELQEKKAELAELIESEKQQLRTVANMDVQQAKDLLLARIETECRSESGMIIKRVEDETKQQADVLSRKILLNSMQRYAADYTIEATACPVSLPSEEMKGRIIGREGRNIRAFENATGCDLIVDDSPDTVTLSCFDMVRREIARQSLEQLMSDGRIHPARIEEVVNQKTREFDQHLIKVGQEVVDEFHLEGIHTELVRLMGRLRYRSSYGQNVLSHLKETGYLCGMVAAELGLNVKMAQRCGLLHDIGKAVSHEVEGPHAIIGAELARKYGESEEVVHAIEAHHEDVPPKSAMAVLTIVGDAISGSRPGARGDTLENYIKRLKTLEGLCDQFQGVDKAYAIQAGREVRVIVEPDTVTDLEAISLAREIKRKVEHSLEYPGQIKITVVRETRSVEYAR